MRKLAVTISVMLLFGCAHAQQDSAVTPAQSPMPAPTAAPIAHPLILERNEGERRQWRYPGFPARFILKVDPHNGGSAHLVLGTERLAPGEKIQVHKHPLADEILFLQNGEAKAMVAGITRQVHGGSMVFIPANTWLSLNNNGKEPIDMIFIFSAPGFEDFMRAESAPAGQKIILVTPAEDAALTKKYSDVVIYK